MVDIKISKIEERSFLRIGNETIEVADYSIKSSADGTTELSVVIKGIARLLESSANLEVQMK